MFTWLNKFKLFRFVVSGGTATVINFGAFFILSEILGVWYITSSVIAFCSGIIVGFFLQRIWTFGHKTLKAVKRQFVMYLILTLINLIINTAVVYYLVENRNWRPIFGQIAAGFFIALVSYVSYRYVIFHERWVGDFNRNRELPNHSNPA